MRERPIIFNDAMVRAILEGRKTQTRRIAKNIVRVDGGVPYRPANNEWGDEVAKCPYGKIGDLLWVREAWTTNGRPLSECTGPEDVTYRASANEAQTATYAFKPSIHMPRWASRITLKIVSIGAEKIDEILEEDAIAEGIESVPNTFIDKEAIPILYKDYSMGVFHFGKAKTSFKTLWDSINAKRGYGFDKNPFVYAIRFERIQ